MTEQISKLMMVNLGITEDNIQGFAREKRDWLEHERKVDETKNLQDDDPAKYAWFPAPRAHPLIMSVVSEEGIADYEIVDDMYIRDDEEFAKKKSSLFNKVAEIERIEGEKLVPPGKGRLMNLHEQRIQEEDNVRTSDIANDRMSKKMLIIPDEITALAIASRRPEDAQFMTQMKAMRAELKAIEWWAAEQQSLIADLTPETIDAFEVAPYER